MTEIVLNLIAGLLVAMAPLNVYFVWHAHRLHRAITPRSALLFALLGVSVTVWVMGVYIAFIAARTLLHLPPLSFSGIGVGIAILALELLPAFIWWQMRRFVSAEAKPDAVVSIDESSIIVFANPAAYELFGWQPGTLEGKPLGLIQPDRFRAAHLAAFPHYLKTGVRTLDWNAVHVAGLHKDGSEFPIVIMLHEHVVEGQRLFTGIIRAEHDQS